MKDYGPTPGFVTFVAGITVGNMLLHGDFIWAGAVVALGLWLLLR